MSRKQEQAIAALLTCPNLPKAAESCSISTRTLKLWLTDANFKEAYRQAREGVLTEAIANLKAGSCDAVALLVSTVRNKRGSSALKIKAAIGILNFVLGNRGGTIVTQQNMAIVNGVMGDAERQEILQAAFARAGCSFVEPLANGKPAPHESNGKLLNHVQPEPEPEPEPGGILSDRLLPLYPD